MPDVQCTLSRPVDISGVGLFLGEPVRLKCLPAEPDSGIAFKRIDLPGKPVIRVELGNVPGPQRWTALRNGAAEVRMVEHLLAACHGLGIDNLIIESSAAEMPVGDGSSRTFTDAFLAVGLTTQAAPRRRARLARPVIVAENDAFICAAPAESGLTLTYILDYGISFIKAQAFTAHITKECFVGEIAPARTYVLRPEVDGFIKLGLGRGATPENTLVLEEDGRIQGKLRFPEECARHKILDMMGDLLLAGPALPMRVLGYKSGHGMNAKLAKAISEAAIVEK